MVNVHRLTMKLESNCNPLLRCCFVRMTRAAILMVFLLSISAVVIVIFTFLNQDHVQLSGIKAHLHGQDTLFKGFDLPEATLNIKSREGKDVMQSERRPMVQFYPDNQNKLLFRKNNILQDHNAANWNRKLPQQRNSR